MTSNSDAQDGVEGRAGQAGAVRVGVCGHCGVEFVSPVRRGPAPVYCRAAHRQRALEARQRVLLRDLRDRGGLRGSQEAAASSGTSAAPVAAADLPDAPAAPTPPPSAVASVTAPTPPAAPSAPTPRSVPIPSSSASSSSVTSGSSAAATAPAPSLLVRGRHRWVAVMERGGERRVISSHTSEAAARKALRVRRDQAYAAEGSASAQQWRWSVLDSRAPGGSGG